MPPQGLDQEGGRLSPPSFSYLSTSYSTTMVPVIPDSLWAGCVQRKV